MSLVTQFSSRADFESIKNIVFSNDKLHGVDLNSHYDGIFNAFHNAFDDDDVNILHCSEDNIMIGVMIQRFWKNMPFWNPGLQFVNKEIWTTKMFTKTIDVCRSLADFACVNAENKKVYDYMSVIRGTSQEKRNVKFSSSKFLTEYNHNTWKVISPGEIPSLRLYKNLLGFSIGKNTKPIMIRHSSMKSEYRN